MISYSRFRMRPFMRLACKSAASGSLVALAGFGFASNSLDSQSRLPSFGEWKVEKSTPKPIITSDNVLLSRKIVSPVDRTGLGLRLYQYQTCPFCSKVRAFLDYYGFSYEVVEVHPVTRKQIKFTKQKKVPVLAVRGVELGEDGEDLTIIDSTFIMSLLRTYLVNESESLADAFEQYPVHTYEDDKGQTHSEPQNKYFINFHEQLPDKQAILNKKEEREWREWVDNTFVHLISPNVYRSLGESVDTFTWFSQVGDWHVNFPAWERWLAVYVGAVAMYFIAKRLKKRHELSDDVRAHLYGACQQWTKALDGRPFMGGDQPNVADLALYGSFSSFLGTQAFTDVQQQTDIGRWYAAVDERVRQHAGAEELMKKQPITANVSAA